MIYSFLFLILLQVVPSTSSTSTSKPHHVIYAGDTPDGGFEMKADKAYKCDVQFSDDNTAMTVVCRLRLKPVRAGR